MDLPVFHLKGAVRVKASEPEDFHGPLDLILHLLSKHKMELNALSLTLIVEQYLAYLDEREKLNLSVTSEFVSMAAHLMYLKTRLLLAETEEEVGPDMEELVSSLESHQRHEWYETVAKASGQLAQGYKTGADFLTKRPEWFPEETPEYDANSLSNALERLVDRQQAKRPVSLAVFQALVSRKPYPVDEKANEILHVLSAHGKEHLWLLLSQSKDRSELVATFLAVLELCKNKILFLIGEKGEKAVLFLAERKNR